MHNAPDPQELAEAVRAAMYAADHAARHAGIEIVAIGPGLARARMKVRAEHANSHGICHGGMLFMLADTAFAYACNSHNHTTVASGCAIDFVAPAHVGDSLTATAEERNIAGRTGIYDIELSNQDGRRIALFRGRSYRIKGEVIPPADDGEGPDTLP